MAYSFIARTKKSNGTTTPSINTTGADLIVISISGESYTPTDSKSNVWTALTKSTTGVQTEQLFYCHNPTTDIAHTFTQSNAGGSIFVAAYSGSAATLSIQESGSIASAASVQPGSITPAAANELVIFGGSVGGNVTGWAIDSGYSLDALDGASGVNYGGGMAYLIQTSAAATNPTFSWNTSSNAAACLASFAAAVVTNTFIPRRSLMGVGR